jgi:menaquinone-dependent protoporphyrinogen oxidase
LCYCSSNGREDTPENRAKADSYFDWLRGEVTPVDTAAFAGKMDCSRLSFIERFIIKYIKEVSECDLRVWQKINEWAVGLLPKLTNTK